MAKKLVEKLHEKVYSRHGKMMAKTTQKTW